MDARHVFAAAILGPVVHLTHYGIVVWVHGGFINPAVTATEGIFASVALLSVSTLARRAAARRISPARA